MTTNSIMLPSVTFDQEIGQARTHPEPISITVLSLLRLWHHHLIGYSWYTKLWWVGQHYYDETAARLIEGAVNKMSRRITVFIIVRMFWHAPKVVMPKTNIKAVAL